MTEGQSAQPDKRVITDPQEMTGVLNAFRLGIGDAKDGLSQSISQVVNLTTNLIQLYGSQKKRIEQLEKCIKDNKLEVPPEQVS